MCSPEFMNGFTCGKEFIKKGGISLINKRKLKSENRSSIVVSSRPSGTG